MGAPVGEVGDCVGEVGDAVGVSVGGAVGLAVGEVGACVGEVADVVGVSVGGTVGLAVGRTVGAVVGVSVGSAVGDVGDADVGVLVGARVGAHEAQLHNVAPATYKPLSHPESRNALKASDVIVDGRLMVLRFPVSRNACVPMKVTLFPSSTEVRPWQL